MYLARKITRAKWDAEESMAEGEIPADAVTVDLKTQSNTLSFWQCEPTSENGVEEAALAIAAAGNHIDKVDIVWFDREELTNGRQYCKQVDGRTPVADLAPKHVDVCQLDYVRLGEIARCITGAIKGGQCLRFTRADVKKLIKVAIEQQRVQMNELGDRIREELGNAEISKA